MTDQPPENLVARLQAREHDAFDQLVRLCHAPVFRLAQRLLRNVDDAQEVAQDTFLAAYEGIGGFQGRASIKTWLMAITYRKAVDRLKKRTDEKLQLAGGFDDSELWKIAKNVDDFTDWGENPEEHMNRRQISGVLDQALSKLPADSRAVFELRDIQGLSSREASEILGLNEGAIRVRLHRVRQYLMRELQNLLGEKRRST